MPGTLYVVATPIGNLEDVTLRALRVLREVSVVAAEDTRRTSRLLQHYSISTPTTSLHAHNELGKAHTLLRRLGRGESVALVSDAGTPVVSDPGARLIAETHRLGIRVEPVPGPSAVTAALSASGFSGEQFLFLGFPPSRAAARRKWLSQVAGEVRPLILYEAPHRIRQTLEDLRSCLGDRTVALGRELTKAHEELVVRPISGHLEALSEERGEFTLVVGPPEPSTKPASLPSRDLIAQEFSQLTLEGGLGRRPAIKTLATKYGVPSREVYKLVQTTPDSAL
jgi:16S rRNA (cytidine1402-2'-O)-methyltransferase